MYYWDMAKNMVNNAAQGIHQVVGNAPPEKDVFQDKENSRPTNSNKQGNIWSKFVPTGNGSLLSILIIDANTSTKINSIFYWRTIFAEEDSTKTFKKNLYKR